MKLLITFLIVRICKLYQFHKLQLCKIVGLVAIGYRLRKYLKMRDVIQEVFCFRLGRGEVTGWWVGNIDGEGLLAFFG